MQMLEARLEFDDFCTQKTNVRRLTGTRQTRVKSGQPARRQESKILKRTKSRYTKKNSQKL